MKSLTKYISNVSALQFIQLLRFSTLFLIGFVFVRYFSTSEIGEYETLIFIAGAISFFWLRGLLQTFLALAKKEAKRSDGKNPALFNAFILLFFFSLLGALFLIIFKGSLQGFLNNDEAIPYFKWLVLYIILGSPANFVEYVYLAINKPKFIFVYGIISYLLQFVVLVLPALLKYPMEVSIIGLVIVNALRFAWLLIILKKHSGYHLNWPFIKQHLSLALPLIGSALLSGSAQYIDGIIITRYFDDAMFAVFRYGARELPLALILANALSNALIPEYSTLTLSEALTKLKRNVGQLMHFLFPVTLILLIISHWLFTHFFSVDFALSAQIFNVYLLLIISRMLFPQTILIGLQKTKLFMWVSLIEISINIGLSLWFVNMWGVLGVAYASVVAFSIEKIILSIIVKSRLSISINQYLPVGWYLVYSLLTILVYFIVQQINY